MPTFSEPLRGSAADLQSITRESKYLNALPLERHLSLITAGRMTRFPRKSLLLEEGAEIEDVYLILGGMVSIGLYRNENPTMWLYSGGPGTTVDVCALLDPPVSPVSVTALSDVEALAIPRPVFADVIADEPAVGYEILQHLASRLSLISRVAVKECYEEYPGPSMN